MTHDEINTLHMSGTQFSLDSDEIDAALAHADLDPTTCTLAEAITACQEFANAWLAFGQFPTRRSPPTFASYRQTGQTTKNRLDGRANLKMC